MTDTPETPVDHNRVSLSIDRRDLAAVAGVVLMVGGAAIVHVGLAVTLAGLGLFGWAWIKSR